MKKLAVTLSFALLTVSGNPAWAEEYELSVASHLTPLHTVSIWLNERINKIEERTNGELIISLYNNASLVKPENVRSSLINDAVDMGLVLPTFTIMEMPYLSSYSMPFLASDSWSGAAVVRELLKEPEVQNEITPMGKLLCSMSSGSYIIMSTKSPIYSPADLKGKRIITTGPTAIKDIEAWGGIPVNTPMTDYYVALQRGMGEAVYTAIPIVTSYKLAELCKYALVMPSGMTGMPIMITQRAFDSLPENLQNIIMEELGSEEASISLARTTEEHVRLDIEEYKKEGVEVSYLTHENEKLFADLSVPVQKEYWIDIFSKCGLSKEQTDAWFEKLNRISEKVANEYPKF